MKRFIFAAVATLILAHAAGAQEPAREVSKAEVFAGYSYLRADSKNLNGWNASVVGNVNHWLGIAADFSGHYRSEPTAGGTLKESMHSFTFGPHFALRKHPKLTPFAFTLIGVSHESVSAPGVSDSETGFDTDLGGGLDWHASEKVAVRLIQANAAIARLGGVTKTDVRLSFGVVFHLGKK